MLGNPTEHSISKEWLIIVKLPSVRAQVAAEPYDQKTTVFGALKPYYSTPEESDT